MIEHHGVKGMKWGVRRYKDLRKQAIRYQKTLKKEGHRVYDSNVNVRAAEKKAEKSKQKLVDLQMKKDYSKSSRYDNSISRAKEKNDKDNHMLKGMKEDRLARGKQYNRASYRYQKLLNEASNLPVNVKLHRYREAAAVFVKADMLRTVQFVAPFTGAIKVDPKSKKSRFDESVYYRQSKKYSQD